MRTKLVLLSDTVCLTNCTGGAHQREREHCSWGKLSSKEPFYLKDKQQTVWKCARLHLMCWRENKVTRLIQGGFPINVSIYCHHFWIIRRLNNVESTWKRLTDAGGRKGDDTVGSNTVASFKILVSNQLIIRVMWFSINITREDKLDQFVLITIPKSHIYCICIQ